jgi:ferrous iron transport protein A
MDLIPLQMLSEGQVARVDHLLGSPADVQRLQEMGMHQGAEIEMVQPGSPCIVRLGGAKVCLRGANLFQILVRPTVAMRLGA